MQTTPYPTPASLCQRNADLQLQRRLQEEFGHNQVDAYVLNAQELTGIWVNLNKSQGKSDEEVANIYFDLTGVALDLIRNLTSSVMSALVMAKLGTDMQRSGNLLGTYRIIQRSGSKLIVFSGWPGLRRHLNAPGLISLVAGYYAGVASVALGMAIAGSVIVQHTGVTVYYAGFPLLSGMLLLGLYSLWLALRGKRYPAAVNRKVMNLVIVLIVTGLIGMFVGRYIANTLWAETFENAGYTQCSGSFSITKQWSTVVWVVDPYLCTDEKVRDMFRSFEHDLSDINAYFAANRSSGVYQ